jgi:lambda repressor-like predicted transcriptional regulator
MAFLRRLTRPYCREQTNFHEPQIIALLAEIGLTLALLSTHRKCKAVQLLLGAD